LGDQLKFALATVALAAVVTAPIVRAPFHNTHESFYFFLDLIFISRTHVWWGKPLPFNSLGFIALGITSHLVNFYFNYKKIPIGIVERLGSPYFGAPPHRLLPNPLLQSNSGRANFMFVQHFIALTD
jgi:hypothetical protein